MKILHYRSRTRLILDILFKPKKVIDLIQHISDERITNIYSEFNEKLEFIKLDGYVNGIVPSSYDKKHIPIIQMPLVDYSTSGSPHVTTTVNNIKINNISASYMGNDIERVKQDLALVLSRKLIDEGFIQSSIIENTIIFKVNTFGI